MREIYSKAVIEYAAEQFKELLKIDIKETNTSFVCGIEVTANVPEDIVLKEFENFMIDYLNSEKMYE